MIIKGTRYEEIMYRGVKYSRNFSDGVKDIPERDRETLQNLRAAIINRQISGEDAEFYTEMREVDLGYMTPEELQAICDPRFVVGIDFKTIDTTPPFTSADMNLMYPGAVDVKYWRKAFANASLFWSKHMESVETSIGVQAFTSELYRNVGIEDIIAANTIAQGINLHNILLAQTPLPTSYRFRYNPVNNPIEFTYLEE